MGCGASKGQAIAPESNKNTKPPVNGAVQKSAKNQQNLGAPMIVIREATKYVLKIDSSTLPAVQGNPVMREKNPLLPSKLIQERTR